MTEEPHILSACSGEGQPQIDSGSGQDEQQPVRHPILDFAQFDGERFHQAWDRFGQLMLDCSDHDFDRQDFLQLLLTGLRPETLDFVRSRSWGDSH